MLVLGSNQSRENYLAIHADRPAEPGQKTRRANQCAHLSLVPCCAACFFSFTASQAQNFCARCFAQVTDCPHETRNGICWPRFFGLVPIFFV